MEKPSKVVDSRSHTTPEESEMPPFPDRKSCSRPCVWIVLSDTQQSRDVIEDIESAKGDSFDGGISI
jgi:hypothetical protein